MDSLKILPMRTPLITSYSKHADIFASFVNNESIVWFFENYVQLFGRNKIDINYIDFCVPNPMLTCPFIDHQIIKREFLNSLGISIRDFIIKSIDFGLYIFLFLNQYYLHGTYQYMSRESMHECYIYGYDMSKKVFKVADFFKSKYEFIEMKFSEIEDSYYKICYKQSGRSDYLHDIVLLQQSKDISFKFNYIKMKSLFYDYLNSSFTETYIDGYTPKFIRYAEDKFVFGMEIYTLLYKYIDSHNTDNNGIDIRGFHNLYDHKKLMNMRLRYLVKEGYLSEKVEHFKCSFEKLEKSAFILRNMALKYNIVKDNRIIECMKKRLNDIYNVEVSLIKELLQSLE